MMLGMLRFFASQSDNAYMSLFSDQRNAAEKDILIFQTIVGSVRNYDKQGRAFSRLNLAPDGGGSVNNSGAFRSS